LHKAQTQRKHGNILAIIHRESCVDIILADRALLATSIIKSRSGTTRNVGADKARNEHGNVELPEYGLHIGQCTRNRGQWGQIAVTQSCHCDEAEIDPLAAPSLAAWFGESGKRTGAEQLEDGVSNRPEDADHQVQAYRADDPVGADFIANQYLRSGAPDGHQQENPQGCKLCGVKDAGRNIRGQNA